MSDPKKPSNVGTPDTSDMPMDEAVERLVTLVTQMPSSSSFESPAIAKQILDYTRHIQALRNQAVHEGKVSPQGVALLKELEELRKRMIPTASKLGPGTPTKP